MTSKAPALRIPLPGAWREDAGRRRAAGDEAGARAIEACLARLEGM